MSMRIKSYGYESRAQRSGLPGADVGGANADISAFGGGPALGGGIRRLAEMGREIHGLVLDDEAREKEALQAADLVRERDERLARIEGRLEEIKKDHPLDKARDAETLLLQWLDKEREETRTRWADNPPALRYMDRQMDGLAGGALRRLRAYSREQGDLYKERVHADGRERLFARAADPDARDGELLPELEQIRREGRALFAGGDPTERNARLDETFQKARAVAEKRRLAALSESDPQAALDEVRALRRGLEAGEAEGRGSRAAARPEAGPEAAGMKGAASGGTEPAEAGLNEAGLSGAGPDESAPDGAASSEGAPAEAAVEGARAEPRRESWLSAGELDLEEERIKARIRENENTRVEAGARIERGGDDLLSAGLRSGDFSAAETAEAELARLDNPEAAAGLRRRVEMCRRAQPALRANDGLPFAERLAALGGLFGLRGSGEEDGEDVGRRLAAAFPGVLYAQAGGGGAAASPGMNGQRSGNAGGTSGSGRSVVAGAAAERPVPIIERDSEENKAYDRQYSELHKLSLEKQAEALPGLSPVDRFYLLGAIDKNMYHNDDKAKQEVLLFCGVGAKTIAQAFDPGISDDQFRKSMNISMMPEDMRESTRKYMQDSAEWAGKNRAQLNEWNNQWRSAAQDIDKERLILTMYKNLSRAMGVETVELRQDEDIDAPIIIKHTLKTGKIEILLNLKHSAFGTKGELTRDFGQLMGAMLHEIAHVHQIQYMSPLVKDDVLTVANSLTMSLIRPIKPVPGRGANIKPYMAQPPEMQGFVIHNSFAAIVNKLTATPKK